MKPKPLTDAELLLLGLVAEMPRHGYDLEQVIENRGMREWSQIGFSSIYFVLGKLETAGLVTAEATAVGKARKAYAITPAGQETLMARTLEALATYRPVYSSLLLGMVHWPIVTRDAALQALEARVVHVAEELARLERVRFQRQPQPDFVEALFDFSRGQLEAERTWIAQTLDYMKTKP